MLTVNAKAAGRPAERVPVHELLMINPAVQCCDCKQTAAGAQRVEHWMLWLDRDVYCPKCAHHRGMDAPPPAAPHP